MRGAERRRAARLADAAIAAWVGARSDAEGLRDFVSGLLEARTVALSPEAQGRALDSLKQKMAVISMDEYRARRRGR